MPLPSETFKVFISHATTADGNLANWMADALDRLHIRAYVYERYQMGGQNRFETIKGMITTCPYFLVVLTKAGIESQWVNQEIGYAVAKGRNPIPIVEVESSTGKRLDSKGFVELNDPISYYRNQEILLMANVVYTLQNLFLFARKWQDLIFLSCVCGNEFEGQLQFRNHWDEFVSDQNQKPFIIPWICQKCGREVTISFPDCHLLPQTD